MPERKVKKGQAKLLSMVPIDRTYGHKRFPLNTRKRFLAVRVAEHWHRLPEDVVESPFLEVLKSHLAMVLGSWI